MRRFFINVITQRLETQWKTKLDSVWRQRWKVTKNNYSNTVHEYKNEGVCTSLIKFNIIYDKLLRHNALWKNMLIFKLNDIWMALILSTVKNAQQHISHNAEPFLVCTVDENCTCPRTIIMGPLMLDWELSFQFEGFPSNHSCASPDAESHVEQSECHVFSL